MKSKEEIEQLADKFATSIYGFRNENHNSYLECKRNCIEFYTQCQEDMTDKVEVKWNEYRLVTNNEDAWLFKQWLISSLNKQD